MNDVGLRDAFETFGDSEKKINQYERKNCIQFYKRDPLTVIAARKRVNRPLSFDIGLSYHDNNLLLLRQRWSSVQSTRMRISFE